MPLDPMQRIEVLFLGLRNILQDADSLSGGREFCLAFLKFLSGLDGNDSAALKLELYLIAHLATEVARVLELADPELAQAQSQLAQMLKARPVIEPVGAFTYGARVKKDPFSETVKAALEHIEAVGLEYRLRSRAPHSRPLPRWAGSAAKLGPLSLSNLKGYTECVWRLWTEQDRWFSSQRGFRVFPAILDGKLPSQIRKEIRRKLQALARRHNLPRAE
jgi:hypothetical protein